MCWIRYRGGAFLHNYLNFLVEDCLGPPVAMLQSLLQSFCLINRGKIYLRRMGERQWGEKGLQRGLTCVPAGWGLPGQPIQPVWDSWGQGWALPAKPAAGGARGIHPQLHGLTARSVIYGCTALGTQQWRYSSTGWSKACCPVHPCCCQPRAAGQSRKAQLCFGGSLWTEPAGSPSSPAGNGPCTGSSCCSPATVSCCC